jgi:thiamine biosynthesis lipoprotein
MKSHCGELRRARPLLGTIVEITIDSHQKRVAERAIERAFASIAAIHQQMSFHDPNSMLSRLNREAFDRPVAVDDKTFQVLAIARDLYLLSDGLFDPTIAPTLQRSGFLPASDEGPIRSETSFADVELLNDNRVRFRCPGVRLDLGGIAKGFAVDEAMAVLERAGIDTALVNAGGDLRTSGSFGVGIRHPHQPGRPFISLSVNNLALATSGHYFADRSLEGSRIGPFVDARLRQLRGNLLSVTVVASHATVADALTKIVMLDPPNAPVLLRRLGAAALVFDRHGSILCTSNWDETLQAAA